MMRKRVRAEKRGGQSGEGPVKKQENLGEKLRKVGKRGGHSTPIIPFWRLYQLQHHHHQDQESHTGAQDSILGASARKLAATLWELHHYKQLPLAKMHRHHHRLYEENTGLDPSPILPELPESAGSLRRHVVASLLQHRWLVERSNRAIQPVSPASYSSSMEVAPYNPAVTPSSSIDFKGRTGEGGYSLRTSTELLKVLNRIWSLEEQHVSNMTLVRKLKKELDHAHKRNKELLREQQADRREVDELMKQITEDKLVRKSKEQDRINAARDELDDERKLRKRSESLHRKLARELSEVKTSLASAVKELERERKSRKLLEDLCDEFARGISDYEQELHSLRQKPDKEWTESERIDNDRLILHISESWLDERMQTQHGGREENPTMEKLSSEIENFLRIKRAGITSNGNFGGPMNRRNSLESIPLNGAVSAPQNEGDEHISAGSDSHCFELEQGKTIQESLAEISTPKKSDKFKITEERKSKARGLNSNCSIDDLIRNHNFLSECGIMTPEDEYGATSFGNSNWRIRASPVRQWTEKLPSCDNNEFESSSKLPPDSKEHTLKSKLLEVKKQQGQQSRSRLKGSKIPGLKSYLPG